MVVTTTTTTIGIWRTKALMRIALHFHGGGSGSCDDDDDVVACEEAARNHDVLRKTSLWKRMACLTTIPCQRERNLLLDVHGSLSRRFIASDFASTRSFCW